MHTVTFASISISLGAFAAGVWLYLFFLRGRFWHLKPFNADHADLGRPPHLAPDAWPTVVAVVPARNEAATIARTVAALASQNYPGPFSIVVVDDHSDDGTAAIARQVACENAASGHLPRKSAAQVPLPVYSAAPLPSGWTGKLWALQQGVDSLKNTANPASPAFYWFTDADVLHAPNTLTRLIARAECGVPAVANPSLQKLDLVSLMVLLQAQTFAERALIPAFLYFFLMLYPPRWIANGHSRTAGAAGGCILLRCEALERIGGLGAIRGEVIDDCALASAVKRRGGRIWMGLTRASVSLRGYENFREVRDMIARTAFTQLHYTTSLLAATLAGMLLTYVTPVALLLTPHPVARILGFVALALMTVSFSPTTRFYRLSPLWALTLPVAAIFYSYATCLSATRYWMGRGAQWKGRIQAERP